MWNHEAMACKAEPAALCCGVVLRARRALATLLSPRLLLVLALLPAGCEEQVAEDEAEMRRLFDEGRELDRQGQHHLALVQYEQILAKHPTWMSTRLNAAMAAYDSGNYSKAAGHFETLHKLGPKDWFVIRKLIQCYERLGDQDKIELYRGKLTDLRNKKDGSQLLKSYQGFTRDYIPQGSLHIIGYEFFDPQQHGRLWLFRLEDHHRHPISAFLVEASPFHDGEGRRLFYVTEHQEGWLRVWYIGKEGRDYGWARKFILEVMQNKHRPLVVKPLPAQTQLLELPGDTAGSPDVEFPGGAPAHGRKAGKKEGQAGTPEAAKSDPRGGE